MPFGKPIHVDDLLGIAVEIAPFPELRELAFQMKVSPDVSQGTHGSVREAGVVVWL